MEEHTEVPQTTEPETYMNELDKETQEEIHTFESNKESQITATDNYEEANTTAEITRNSINETVFESHNEEPEPKDSLTKQEDYQQSQTLEKESMEQNQCETKEKNSQQSCEIINTDYQEANLPKFLSSDDIENPIEEEQTNPPQINNDVGYLIDHENKKEPMLQNVIDNDAVKNALNQMDEIETKVESLKDNNNSMEELKKELTNAFRGYFHIDEITHSINEGTKILKEISQKIREANNILQKELSK